MNKIKKKTLSIFFKKKKKSIVRQGIIEDLHGGRTRVFILYLSFFLYSSQIRKSNALITRVRKIKDRVNRSQERGPQQDRAWRAAVDFSLAHGFTSRRRRRRCGG